jgi:hypothetical protein
MSEVGPIRNELMLDIMSSFSRNAISIV